MSLFNELYTFPDSPSKREKIDSGCPVITRVILLLLMTRVEVKDSTEEDRKRTGLLLPSPVVS